MRGSLGLAAGYAAVLTLVLGGIRVALSASLRHFPRLAVLKPVERVHVCTTVVSILHACVMFHGSVTYLWPLFSRSNGVALFSYTAVTPLAAVEAQYVSIMLGYLVFDCFVSTQEAGFSLDLVLHHVVGGASYAAILYYNTGGLYAMTVQLAEGSTPFLHTAMLLYKLGLQDSAAYKACAALTLLLFTLLRVVLQPLNLVTLYRRRALWAPVSMRLWASQFAVTTFFVVLNLFWWVKLVAKSAQGVKAAKRAQKKAR